MKHIIDKWPDMFDQCDCEEIPEYWSDNIVALCTILDGYCKLHSIELKVMQVKEKFGGLRFYYMLAEATNQQEHFIRNLVGEVECLCRMPTIRIVPAAAFWDTEEDEG